MWTIKEWSKSRIMLGISAVANLITNSPSTVANPAIPKLHHNERHHKKPQNPLRSSFFTKISHAGSQVITAISFQVSSYILPKGLVSKR